MYTKSDDNAKPLTGAEYQALEDYVYNYPTRFKEGFIWEEQDKLLKALSEKYPNINMEKYDSVLTGITCTMNEGRLTIYHCDILQALVCGIENRDQTIEEWD